MCEFNIQELNLANYRRFENETFTLNPRMNVFAGKNGSGKNHCIRGRECNAGSVSCSF